jgi:hypothetical protein
VKDSHYKGDKKFDREQLTFIVHAILIGALDRIESGLPDTIRWQDRLDQMKGVDPLGLTDYERGGIDTAGMALGVLCAQLTGEGLGVSDALSCANNFEEACDNFVIKAWVNEGKEYKDRFDSMMEKSEGKGLRFKRFAKPFDYPNTRKHAQAFVKNVFKEYLAKE